MEVMYQGESQKQRTGEPDMLKELMGPHFSKSIENELFVLRDDKRESKSNSISPKIMIWMERNYAMPVKRTM